MEMWVHILNLPLGWMEVKRGTRAASLIGEVIKASFVSTGSIPIEMDKYNKTIMIVTIRDPDLFRVEN
jgi:hypothetical protein